MADFDRPPPLEPGAALSVVASSSPFDRARFDAGAALLGAYYRLQLGDALFARQGFLAGDDARRAHDFQSALRDPDTRAIVTPRGGYGATRLLPELAVDEVKRAAKWLVGFSDVTALHALWARARLCSVHGPMVCSLPEASPALQHEWHRLLSGAPPLPLTGLACMRPGRAAGRLFGGNLTVLAALLGTPYFPALEGVVLALEDVSERPYRLDRMLTTLLQSGALAGVRAIVLGQFTDCAEGADGVSALSVLEERLSTLGVPLLADGPFGHIAENRPLLLGAHAELDASAGTVSFGS